MKKISYKDAGVDIEKGDSFVQAIKPMVESTFRPDVVTGLGGFAGCVSLSLERYKKPILVSSTDGVGTKLKIAFMMDRHDTIGIDLVAMCVNDIVVTGARPLFLLDYLATSQLDPARGKAVVEGIVKGCMEAECSLIGGETAEMPGFYKKGEYDLAGFAVGIVENAELIDGTRVTVGDKVIGIASSGLHSNGFSLARKVFPERELKGETGRRLLRPTRIYTPVLLRALRTIPIKAMAHITGGGFYDNIPRVLPEGRGARIQRGSWPVLDIFRAIQRRGSIGDREMFRTFNMGVGMVVVVDGDAAPAAVRLFESLRCPAWRIGTIVSGRREVVLE